MSNKYYNIFRDKSIVIYDYSCDVFRTCSNVIVHWCPYIVLNKHTHIYKYIYIYIY